MSKNDKQHALVPRLRFPEFRDSRVWEQKPLSALTVPVNERVGDSDCVPYTITSGEGLVSQEEKYGRTIAGKSLKNYYRLQHNDFAFNKSATKGFPQGYIARFKGDEFAAVPNSIFTCFRIADENVDAAYLDYLFQGNLHGRWLKNYITVGARAHGALNISDDDLYALPVPLPAGDKSLAEQLKIADCLGSLDDLIAAEGRKLAALRDHKKGLMQQLFPREGETCPRLRLPEFQDAPEWKRDLLGDIAAISKGRGLAKSDVDADGETPCIRYGELYTIYGEVIEEVRSRTNLPVADLVLSQAGDVIIPASGEKKEDIATCACVMSAGVALGSDLNIIRSPVDGRFFSYYLNGNRRRELAKVAQGDTVAHLYPTQLSMLELYIPVEVEEQHRIADCLSALDARIAAQAEKLDALRTHKRGLMQQLFPSPEGAEA